MSNQASLRDERAFLQARVMPVLRPDWEKALWFAVLALAVLTRFWDLGTRVYNHDETTHALYSWQLYQGQSYRHDPMSHGPFLYHLTALVFTLFGTDDFTGRVSAALFGVLAVMLPILLRREMGRVGALLAGWLLLISPSFVYFSRFIRHDIFAVAWSFVLVIAFFRYLEEGHSRYIYLAVVVLTLSLCTKEVAYIFGYLALTFILCALLGENAPEKGSRSPLWWVLASLVIFLTAGLAALLIFLPRWGERRVTKALAGIRLPTLLTGLATSLGIYVVLYSTLFTEISGLGTGILGSMSYWLAQHGVQRGNQPWFYYLVLLPMYEYLPILGAMVGLGWWLTRRRNLSLQGSQSLFLPFLLWWAGGSLVIFSWAGEKMPWLGVHLALPIILLAAFTLGRYFQDRDWKGLLSAGGWVPGVLLVPIFFLLSLLTRPGPISGVELAELRRGMLWVSYLGLLGLLVWVAVWYGRRLGRARMLSSLALGGFLLLSGLTLRTAVMASFLHRELPNEMLVFAQGARDLRDLMKLIEDVGKALGQGQRLKIAYDAESSWPLEWYLRDYQDKQFLGGEVSGPVDAEVVMIGLANEAKLKPYVSDYVRQSYVRIWWAAEDYRRLSPGNLLRKLWSQKGRKELWDIFFLRRYPYEIGMWPWRSEVIVYLEHDAANRLWPDVALPLVAGGLDELAEVYKSKQVRREAELAWGQLGMGAGEFNAPKGLALGPDGLLYVADAGNHRIQVFDPDGNFVRSWGSFGSEHGQFNEPWGVGVDGEGRVYVADTWNHRVQVFNSQGELLAIWGGGELTSSGGQAVGAEDGFYGPRDIVEIEPGKICVVDTGNKRIICWDGEGRYLEQWGGMGSGGGRFQEPVGIAVHGAAGKVYVADTWNGRIQAFRTDFSYLHQWRVRGWEGQAVINKPYLTVDQATGRIYATDPEGHHVLVYDEEGRLLEVWGSYGAGGAHFNTPTGIACDGEGRIYVADSFNHRILRFQPGM